MKKVFAAAVCALVLPTLAQGKIAQARTAYVQIQPEVSANSDKPSTEGQTSPPSSDGTPAPLVLFGRPLRSLYTSGVLLSSTFYDDAQANPVGGLSHGSANAGAGTLGADIDLRKIAGIGGARVHLLFTYEFGDTLQKNIGNFIKSQDWYLPFQKFQLAQLGYEQSLLDGRLNLYGGRVSAATMFAKPTFGCNFVSGSQCPYDLPVFTGGFSGFPYATWGGRVRFNPTPRLYVEGGAFSVDPNRKNLHGFDFGLKTATGVAAPVEIGYETDFGNDRYPRHYKLGGWYNNAPSVDPLLNRVGQSRALSGGTALTNDFGRGGIYALADQVIYRPDDSHRSLALFGSYAAPFDQRELFSSQSTLGAYFVGPLANRRHDSAGIMVTGLVFTKAETLFMNQLLGKNGSTTFVHRHQYDIEANYGAQLEPGVVITPNVEYIVHPDTTQRPDARFAPKNAVVVGLRLTLNFNDMLGVPSALPRLR